MRFSFARNGEVPIREHLPQPKSFSVSLRRPGPRPAAAKHTRSSATIPPSRQHGQRRLPAIGKRILGRIPAWKWSVHSKEQTGDSASLNARSRSSDCESLPFGARTRLPAVRGPIAPLRMAGYAATRSFSAHRAGRRTQTDRHPRDASSCHFSCGWRGHGSLRLRREAPGCIPVVLPNKKETVRRALPAETELLVLTVQSVPLSLEEWLPIPTDTLVGIASRWPGFLKLARTMLVAAGFHPDSLVFRNTSEPGWQKGLKQTAAVICDSVTASEMPKGYSVIPFPLLSESASAELRRYQQFVTAPLT